jgi:hypothetical protein
MAFGAWVWGDSDPGVELDKPAQRRDQDRAFVIGKVQPLHYVKYAPRTK